jgi:hypothetical protein
MDFCIASLLKKSQCKMPFGMHLLLEEEKELHSSK